TGTGLDRWHEQLAKGDQARGRTMQVDYDTYAEGEALLAWLNATVRISCEKGLDGNQLLQELATAMQRQVQRDKGEIAHLKMTLATLDGLNEMAMINLVRNEVVPELSLGLHDPVTKGELIVNARAETSPEALKKAFDRALSACARPDQELQLKHFESFRPGRPVPTHRVIETGAS
ncbi:MAG: GTP-binding protein, partial [Limisphaerales bacterium]